MQAHTHIHTYIYTKRERQTENCLICCFSALVPTIAGAGPGRSQEPRASSKSLTWMRRPGDSGYPPLLLQLHQQKRGSKVERLTFKSVPILDVGIIVRG